MNCVQEQYFNALNSHSKIDHSTSIVDIRDLPASPASSSTDFASSIRNDFADISSKERLDLMLAREASVHNLLIPDYMQSVQPQGSVKIREDLVSWMFQLVDHFAISNHTVALAVNLLDRFLSKKRVIASVYGAVASACILIATKAHEYHPISIHALSVASKSSREHIIGFEKLILRILNWYIRPTSTTCDFLMAFIYAYNESQEVHELKCKDMGLVAMIHDIATMSTNLLQFTTPVIGAACFLAVAEFELGSKDEAAEFSNLMADLDIDRINLCRSMVVAAVHNVFSQEEAC